MTSKHREVIHEDLYELFHKVRENSQHASLKRGWCIAKPKWHLSVGINTKRASEGGLLLVFRVHHNLVITRIAIQKAIESLTRQSL